MRRLLFSMAMLGLTSALAIGATTAYFSDTEISSANTFVAGTLDLTVDGTDEDVHAKFTVDRMKPGDVLGANGPGLFTNPGQVQCTGGTGYTLYYKLKNTGTLNGIFNISQIVVSNLENGIIEPEQSAGDTTTDIGELATRLKVKVWLDNGNHCIDGNELIFNGKVSELGAINADKLILAGETKYLGLVFYWEPGTINEDNVAMGDFTNLDFTFTLSQAN